MTIVRYFLSRIYFAKNIRIIIAAPETPHIIQLRITAFCSLSSFLLRSSRFAMLSSPFCFSGCSLSELYHKLLRLVK